MARNKYPEETIGRILDAAEELFAKKGYEATSIQDIMDQTKLSKGAIYHHFSSKRVIFEQVCSRSREKMVEYEDKIRYSKGLDGKDKIKEIFRMSLTKNLLVDESRENTQYIMDDPERLKSEMQMIFSETAPHYIAPLLEEGMRDGSIRKLEYPVEVAEALIILVNLWASPSVQPETVEKIRRRCAVYNQILKAFGLDTLDDRAVEAMIESGERMK